MNRIDLEGKIAVVTGGASGIGLATVERFVRSGAHVVIFDVATAPCPPNGSPAVDYRNVDVTDEDTVQCAFDGVLAERGRIDILVNGAGIAGPQLAVAACTLSAWLRVFEVNLTGTFLCCRAVAPAMRAMRRGRIVNVASVAGKDGNPFSAPYAASKAAVIALTKSLGKELADTDVRVNCVTPGAVDTPLLRQMDPTRRAAAAAKIPLGRVAESFEIAAMIAWLASDECSFTTGSAFDLSGGRATY